MTMPLQSLQPLKERWQALQPRERLLLAAGGIFLALFIFYAGLWLPLQKDLKRLRAGLPQAEKQLALMRVQAGQIKRLKNTRRPGVSGGNILSLMEQAVTSRGIRDKITKMEPDGTDGVRLTLEGVPFNTLIDLLSGLQTQKGLRLTNATIDGASEVPGTINARLTLHGAGR